MQVLVVDDSPYVGDVLVSALEHEGCRASIARDRAQALRLSRSLRPDLITVELGPHLDDSFIAELVDQAAPKSTKLIVIAPSARGVSPAIADRAVRVFEKPFYLSEVVAATIQTLGRPARP